MPDDAHPEPITKAEPVVLGDLADLLIYLGGTAGVLIPDDVAAKIVAAVVAIVLWVQSTYLKRKSVTPEVRAEEREQSAYEDGVAAGKGAAPQATVVHVDAPASADTEWERMVPRPERLADAEVFAPAVIPPAPDTPAFPPPEPYGGAHGQASEQPR